MDPGNAECSTTANDRLPIAIAAGCAEAPPHTHATRIGRAVAPVFRSINSAPAEDDPATPLDCDIGEIRATLARLVRQGGPTPDDYPMLHRLMGRIADLRQRGTITEETNDALWDSLGDVGSTKTLMGHIHRKPYGYHGDFEIIDKFYTRWQSPDPRLRRWDEWIQSLPSTQAVRNRKQFFSDLMSAIPTARAPRVLIVGSGPCRDLLEAFRGVPGNFTVVCVDVDPRANAYARQLLDEYSDRVRFIERNALRMNFGAEFDLVWSAGLFDYLDDRLFVAALKRLYRAICPGGIGVVGNFATANPSRATMEWANWRLFHRTTKDLRHLAGRADLGEESVRTRSETLGVNLFVQIKKTS